MREAARTGQEKLGRPTTVVLFRASLKWRFAVYLADPGGVLDGGLADEPADSAAHSAQSAMHAWLEETFHRSFAVTWADTDRADWWTGTVIPTAHDATGKLRP